MCACMPKILREEWRRKDCGMAIPPGGDFSLSVCLCLSDEHMRHIAKNLKKKKLLEGACTHQKERERDRETESEKSSPRGDSYPSIPSPPFFSRDLGHTCICAQREFKPPGPGLELRSTTWESSDIAITSTAGPG